MRVVSIEPEHELTLISDQPTTMYITTRMADAGENRTRITRSFLWEQPDDPDVADIVRQGMQTMVLAGDGAIKEVFAE